MNRLARAESTPTVMQELARFWLGSRSRLRQLLFLLSLFWLAVFGTQWFRVSKDVAGGRRLLGATAETAYIVPVPALKMASLGHQSFAADLMFLRAAHYFVRHLATDSRLPWINLYLDAIWGLDAHNKSTYHWGAQIIKFGQTIDNGVAERADQIARLGLEYFPDDPWLYHEIAFNLRYSIEANSEAEAQRLKTLALSYLEIAYSFPAFTYDPNYLASQFSRAGRDDDAVRSALATYENATEDQRRELREMLKERNQAESAAELAWYDTYHARDWSYLSETLTRFVGPKRVAAPPLHAADVRGWLREPTADAALTTRLGVVRALPPKQERLPGDEDVELAEASTRTATVQPVAPPARKTSTVH